MAENTFMKTEAIRDHFRAQVPEYGDLMKRIIPFYDEQRDIIVRLIPFGRHEAFRVLDLGCGTGLLAAQILSEYPHAELVAFDLTSEMLDACRSRLADMNRVRYTLGDFRTDNLGNDYDVIVASLSLHHLKREERPRFYQRANESLHFGGVLIASEAIIDESPVVRERQYELWRKHMAGNGEDATRWYRKHLEKDHPVPISSLLAMLAGAGFEAAACFWRYLNFAIITARKPAV